jgi:hypothetical protein
MEDQQHLLPIIQFSAPTRNRQCVAVGVHTRRLGKKELIKRIHRLDVDSAVDVSAIVLVIKATVENVESSKLGLVFAVKQVIELKVISLARRTRQKHSQCPR